MGKRAKLTVADNEFERARALVRAKGNPIKGLGALRAKADPQTLLRVAGKFASHPAYKSLVLKSPFPKRFAELTKSAATYRPSFEREVAWLVGLLASFGPNLNDFLQHKLTAEMLSFSGSHAELAATLENIENTFGVSLWLVQNHTNLAASSGGKFGKSRHDQNDYLGAPTLMPFLAVWFHYRANANVSRAEIDRLLDETWKPKRGYQFIAHLLNGRCPTLTPSIAAEMLQELHEFALVDRYEIGVWTLQALVASRALTIEEEAFVKGKLEFLLSKVTDDRIARTICALGGPSRCTFDADYLEELDRYSESEQSCLDEPAKERETVERLNLRLRSRALAGSGAIERFAETNKATVREVERDLDHVLRCSDDGLEARRRLQKTVITNCGAGWAASLELFLTQQVHDFRVLNPSPIQMLCALRADVCQPLLAFGMPARESALRFLDGSDSVSVQALKLILVNDADAELPRLAPSRLLRVKALASARNGDYQVAIKRLEKIIVSSPPQPLYAETSLILLECYLALSLHREAAEIAAQLLVTSRYYSAILPIERLVEALLEKHNEPLATSETRGRLSVAIVFDAYSRFVASDHDVERADAYKDVLRKHSITNASELANRGDGLPHDQLVYFLQYVCVPDVLDQNLSLNSTKAVEDERAAILIALSDLTYDNKIEAPSSFKDELREILTRQIVRDTTLRLDQSKIYVNVDGIRRTIDTTARETWNIYRMMCQHDPSEQIFSNIEKLVSSAYGDQVAVVRLDAPHVERREMLARLTFQIRDEFTSNKEFGLNSNLSTNIRHGYVLREIRGPLMGRNLITNKDSESGSYNPNSYWLDRLDTFSAQILSPLLDAFSAAIDQHAEHLNRRLLRIKSAANTEGLFDYSIGDRGIIKLEQRCRHIEAYEEFINLFFAELWDLTQANLRNVCNCLEAVVLPEILSTIDTFDEQLRTAGFHQSLPGIETAIALAKLDMRSAMERVSSWFKLSGTTEYQDFDLEIAFRAGLETVRAYHRNLEIDCRYEVIPPIIMRGWCLPIFARLFFLILDNAAEHGGRGRTDLNLVVEIERLDTVMSLKILNDVPPETNVQALKTKIDFINKEYGQERAMEMLGEEGGSGFPKIWKLLNTDLRKTHELQVSLSEGNFCVEVLINAADIII